MSDWSVAQEATKAIFGAVVSALTLGLGWFVGSKISIGWALRQKRREQDLSAETELHRLYAEFFAVWKLWNHLAEDSLRDSKQDARWDLAKRATSVDAGFEALLLRLTSERRLDKKARDDLGLLRQGFQHLRESIFRGQPIEWHYSEHPQYVELKRLACVSSALLASERPEDLPTTDDAADALREITSNRYEGAWNGLAPSNMALNATVGRGRPPAR